MLIGTLKSVIGKWTRAGRVSEDGGGTQVPAGTSPEPPTTAEQQSGISDEGVDIKVVWVDWKEMYPACIRIKGMDSSKFPDKIHKMAREKFGRLRALSDWWAEF